MQRKERKWVKADEKLCLSGYPMRIRMEPGDEPFVLEHDGRLEMRSSVLGYLKYEAQRRADELDEFIDA